MSVLNKPQIEAYIGGTGSGKGVSINQRLREVKPARLLMWDPRNEYGAHAPAVPTLPHLVGAFKHAKGGPVRVRYVFQDHMDIAEAFAFCCSLAMKAGNLMFVADELGDVTTPQRAPPAWRRCLTQGRHEGLQIIGAVQRPALVDKTFLSSATQVRCFMLGYDDDCKVMGKELRVSEEVIAGLTTSEQEGGPTEIQYLERIRRTRELYAGQITVAGPKFSEKRAIYGAPATPGHRKGRGAT